MYQVDMRGEGAGTYKLRMWGVVLALLVIGVGCEASKAKLELRLKRSIEGLPSSANNPGPVDALRLALMRASGASLKTPHIAYACIGVEEEDVALMVHWIADSPDADTIRLTTAAGKIVDLAVTNADREANAKASEKVVIYNFFIGARREEQTGADLLRMMKDTSLVVEILNGGSVVSNRQTVIVIK